MILLAAHAGLRKGEILALRCRDCELEHDRLVVRLSRWKKDTKSTKSGHEREVPLTPQLRDALLAAGVDKRPGDECAALNADGEPWGHGGPYRVFQRHAAAREPPAGAPPRAASVLRDDAPQRGRARARRPQARRPRQPRDDPALRGNRPNQSSGGGRGAREGDRRQGAEGDASTASAARAAGGFACARPGAWSGPERSRQQRGNGPGGGGVGGHGGSAILT